MTFLEECHQAHKERIIRLSRRAPEAGPIRMKPAPRVILLGKDGKPLQQKQKAAPSTPSPLPAYPPLPPLPLQYLPLEQSIKKERIEIRRILAIVANEFGIPVETLGIHRRKISIVHPRQIAAWLIRKLMPGISFPVIANRLGGFDHSTIMHSVRRIEKKRLTDATLMAQLAKLESLIRA